ncbi:MAG: hypothetical protein LBP72_01155, partial [Dysgonamonadaceae bacterium]|nr:hypothetical protein [Dysgonamonadaceae bacterium]
MQVKVTQLDEKNINIERIFNDGRIVSNDYPAQFYSVSDRGNVVIMTDHRPFSSVVVAPADLEINGEPAPASVQEAVMLLNSFIGNFNPAVGAASPTLLAFEADNDYKEGDTIKHNGAIYVAKADFKSGADFDPDDWDQLSVNPFELSEVVNAAVEEINADIEEINADIEEINSTISDFEPTANKTTAIREANEANDINFPTELAARKELDTKADKITTPHIDWNPDAFDIPAGRTLHFNTATAPAIAGDDMPILACYSTVNGDADSMFGFFSNDAGATTQFGLFHLNDDMDAFVADTLLYDGAQWLNGSDYVLPTGIAGNFSACVGNNVTVTGFDLTTDITVSDVPPKNLIDVENEVLQLVKSKANIFVRLAQGITIGNNIQGMHIIAKPPFAYFTDWTLTAADGATMVRTDNSFVYTKANGTVVTLVDNGNILINDYVIEEPFLITEMEGSFTNVNLFYRYFDIKDLDQRIGLVSALQTVDKSSIVNAINSLKGYVDGILESSEIAGSPYANYAAFMAGAGATITPSKYAYVTFTDTDTWPTGGNWNKIVAGETWRLDCSDTE